MKPRLAKRVLAMALVALAAVFVTGASADEPGVTFTLSGTSHTTEEGGVMVIKVKLATQPTANVAIAVSSLDTTEGTVWPSSLTFTPLNWNGYQELTVTGQDDEERDGKAYYTIRLDSPTSDDPDYAERQPVEITTYNTDDDVPGITLDAALDDSGNPLLHTSEKGQQDKFTVRLNNAPTQDVIIFVGSSDTGEGTVSPGELVFTSENWSGLQTVTVTGVDDDIMDGDQTYAIDLSTESADSGYNGLQPDKDISAINMDYGDTAGVTIGAVSGNTTEKGGQAEFAVSLTSEPVANVTISVSSLDTSEGTVSPASLTFTSENWSGLQTVTVTGIDDETVDGHQSYMIALAVSSSDTNYTSLEIADVELVNEDDDIAGFIMEIPEDGRLETTEQGGKASFAVKLRSKPDADVIIGISSSAETEGTVFPGELVFTPENWNGMHTVTITGVDDLMVDGNQSYMVELSESVSDDVNYSGLRKPPVPVINLDDDIPGFEIGDIIGETTEKGGQATFAVSLISQPTSNVSISVTSSNPSEGTVSPASMTFTPEDWNSADHVVTVTGVDESVADGNQSYTVILGPASSSDAYNGKDPEDISLINIDDDEPGFITGDLIGDTTEQGGEATFTVTLTSQPTADVVISLSSSDEGEGTVSPAQLKFTENNWSALHTVTITGVDDAIKDGNQSYTIILSPASSGDGNYDGTDLPDITVINMDYGDEPGFTSVSLSGDNPATSEDGKEQASFSVQLLSEPLYNVTVSVTSSNPSEGTVSPSTLTFTPSDWNSADHLITVTGVDDSKVDGNQSYTVVLDSASSDDTNYNGWNPDDISLINIDDDRAGFIPGELSGTTTSEDEDSVSFTLRLRSEPSDDVKVCAESSNKKEGTVSPQCLIFTSDNWNADQSFIIIGEDDIIDDGDQPYTVIFKPAESGDGNYEGWNPDDISLVNIDNDEAGFKPVEIMDDAITTEEGGQVRIRVELTSQPAANVTIAVSSSDTSEGTVSPSEIVFTSSDWGYQTITVTGQNDDIADGPQGYFVIMAPAASDSAYNGLKIPNIPVTNQDDDKFGFKVSKLSGNTDEDGGQASFTVELTSEPQAAVSISIYSSDPNEGTVSPSSLNFNAGNWNIAQMVTITGVSDDIVDGNQTYTVVIEPSSSTDSDYDGIDLPDIQVTNINTNVLFPPTELEAKAGIGSIRLYWNDSPSPYLAGYYVYRSDSETGDYVLINSEVVKGNSYTDTSDITYGSTYWYYLTAVDMLGNESTESNKAWAEPGQLKLFIPDSSGATHTQVRLPVNIDNADGLNMCAADIALKYDPSVLYIPPEAKDRAERTALTAMYGWATNFKTPGIARISASCDPDAENEMLYGEGSIFYILFDVVGNQHEWTDMEFEDEDAMTAIYSYDGLYEPLPLDLEDIGRFTVICGFMLGDLTGDCVLTKDDMQMVREISCGNIKLDDENREELLRAGDLSGDGRIRSNDACLIGRLMKGLDLAPSKDAERKRRNSPRSDLANVSIPENIPMSADSSVWVPVNIDDAAELKNGDIVLNYDSSFITATGDRPGSTMENFDMTVNRNNTGQVVITFNAPVEGSNLQGPTTLAEVRFTAKPDIPDDITIPIILASVRLSDDHGRDFETSVRQMDVSMKNGSLIVGEGNVVSPELINTIKALQVVAGMNPDGLDAITDVNSDQKIGLEEAIYLIQVAAEMKEGSAIRR